MSEQQVTVVPYTGEQIVKSAPDKTLVGVRADIDEHVRMCREAKRAIDNELIRRMDADATWTRHTPDGAKITAPSPDAAHEYAPDMLRTVLAELVEAGVVSDDAASRCLSIEMRLVVSPQMAGRLAGLLEEHDKPDVRSVRQEWKVNAADVKRVAKVSPAAAARLDACKVPKDRAVRITRSGLVVNQ